jgi:hypothetical protein
VTVRLDRRAVARFRAASGEDLRVTAVLRRPGTKAAVRTRSFEL